MANKPFKIIDDLQVGDNVTIDNTTGDITTSGAVASGDATFTSLRETKTAPAISSGVLTLDCNVGNVFVVSLSEDITSVIFTNVPTDAYGMTLTLVADGTPRSVVWPASVKWPSGTAPTLTSTLNKEDTFVLITDDTGTTWAAAIAGQDR